jgi:hypothetical protein
MKKLNALVIILALLTAGCSATRLYPGPERPDSEISLITLTDGSLTLDGVAEGLGDGFKVLPGEHAFSFSIAFSDPLPGVPCRIEPRFDSYGYEACMHKREKDLAKDGYSDHTCHRWEYTERYRICLENVYSGSCQGSISTSPGAEYTLAWQRSGYTGVVVTLNGADGRERGVRYSCSAGTPTVETKEERLD